MLGPSGCGKTTLLSIIAGLIKPDRGSVFIHNKNVNTLSPGKRNIGFTFQEYALFPHLTVFDNIAFGLRTAKTKETIVCQKVTEYLKNSR